MSKRSERKSEAQVWDWRVPRRIDGPAAPTRASTALVVGFDRHAASRRALEFAIELGAGLRAYLHVAHVVDTEDLPIDPDSDDWEARICEALDREREQACAVLATSAGNWTYHGRAGDPAKVLIAPATANAIAISVGGIPFGFSDFSATTEHQTDAYVNSNADVTIAGNALTLDAISHNTAPRCAPSAMRTPTSRVRRPTAYATTP